MSEDSSKWLSQYASDYLHYKAAAEDIREQVQVALEGHVHGIHTVEGRAKEPDSVAEKIERRSYTDPEKQLDDLIGIRVITLFDSTVDRVVGRLRTSFRVDNTRSSNKATDMGRGEVGYRSSHVFIKISARNLSKSPIDFHNLWVEVQVRSIISHAWAEIEHSLRYKIGSGIPSSISRRFDLLPGTLELVDLEFSNIEEDTVKHVDKLRESYLSSQSQDEKLSTVQLLAMLRAYRPRLLALGPHDLALPIEMAYRLSKTLAKCGIDSTLKLKEVIDGDAVLGVGRLYAEIDDSLTDPEFASGIIVIGAIIGVHNREVFDAAQVFTEDPSLVKALDSYLSETKGDNLEKF